MIQRAQCCLLNILKHPNRSYWFYHTEQCSSKNKKLIFIIHVYNFFLLQFVKENMSYVFFQKFALNFNQSDLIHYNRVERTVSFSITAALETNVSRWDSIVMYGSIVPVKLLVNT